MYEHSSPSWKNDTGNRGFTKKFQHLLNTGPLDLQEDHLIRFDVVQNDGSTDLAITWLQMLFDGHGFTRFLTLLSNVSSSNELIHRINWNDETRSPLKFPSLPKRLMIEKEWSRTMKELSQPSPASPGGPLTATPKRIRYDVIRFSTSHTQQLDEQARQEAGVISPMIFYLAISLRAHHRIFVRRNDVPKQYLVPVAVNLRPRANIEPVFRNLVSFLWFHASPSDLQPRTTLIDLLLEQKRKQTKSDFPRKMAIALDNNRYLPSWLNRYLIRSQTDGELCSFFFAYTGSFFDGVSSLCGGKFMDGFPAPGVPPSPGSSFIWSHVHDRLNLTHLFQKGAVTPPERKEMKEHINRERTISTQVND